MVCFIFFQQAGKADTSDPGQLFSALNNMLPHSRSYLKEGGYSSSAAAWIELATFLGGVFGIQLFSRLCHHFISHMAVDCDHSHDEENKPSHTPRHDEAAHDRPTTSSHPTPLNERTPLLHRTATSDGTRTPASNEPRDTTGADLSRPTLPTRITSKVSRIVTGPKDRCDADGPCHGWSDPCGTDCFESLSRDGRKSPSWFSRSRGPTPTTPTLPTTSASPQDTHSRPHPHSHDPTHDHAEAHASSASLPDHHHHVPSNPFLSISLQTSIAIALHKLPEGFITYATNHANPTLGFSVFLALFIHNLTEGFALALPIYLATSSRLRALALAALLGGLSQPAGAALAAIWLRATETGRGGDAGDQLNAAVYGALFGVTAGIMASVAVSLVQESFELSHRRQLCLVFIFVGMGVLGVSNALVGGGHA